MIQYMKMGVIQMESEEYFEDDDIYTEEGMESKAEDDEISSSELGFMRGYNEA